MTSCLLHFIGRRRVEFTFLSGSLAIVVRFGRQGIGGQARMSERQPQGDVPGWTPVPLAAAIALVVVAVPIMAAASLEAS